MYNPFSTRYQVSNCERLGVENLNFKFISMVQCGKLVKPFGIEEV